MTDTTRAEAIRRWLKGARSGPDLSAPVDEPADLMARATESCPGSGGGSYSDGAMDRTPTDYWYDCEILRQDPRGSPTSEVVATMNPKMDR